ncbi:MAG TPA: hypothetical protein VKB57_28280, partial [Acidimicrobiales bacterium]|nr:hypothetical protein [Acidimicrobiales bacterium]
HRDPLPPQVHDLARTPETAPPPHRDPIPTETDAPAQAADPAPPPHRGAAPAEVDALARAAVRWAAAWPWSRLRAEPAAFDVPWLDRTPALAAWMDDGMWARWLLSALPHADDLRAAVHSLLCERLAAAVDEVATPSCGGAGPC